MSANVIVTVLGAESALMRRVCDVLSGGGYAVTASSDFSHPVVLIDDGIEPASQSAPRRTPADVVVCRQWSTERCASWLAAGAADCIAGDATSLADLPALIRSLGRRDRGAVVESDASAALRTMLDHTGALVGWVDESLVYRQASAALARFDGRSRSSYPGTPISEASPWAGPAVVALLKRVIDRREPVVNVDLRFRTGSPTIERSCVAGFYPITGTGGGAFGVGIAIEPGDAVVANKGHSVTPAAVGSVGVATSWIDTSARFTGGDEAFQKLVDYSADELTSLTLRDLIHPQDLRSDTALFDWLAGGHGTYHADHRWIKKGGVSLPVRMALSRDGKPGDAITVAVLDLSEVRRTQDLLRRSVAEAESAIAAKDRFLAVLSHELRTPLTPVLASVFAIEKDPAFPAELQAPFDLIRRNVELEARLIDDLLDLTRLSKGNLQLGLENVCVHTLLKQAVELCMHDASTKAVHLKTQLEATRHHVRGDPARLKQVFWNLIRNAIKFTPSGGVVTVRTVDGPGEQIHITVADTGIGIESEAVGRLFSAFEQGERTVSRQFGGLGLGLTISKALVDRHGGSLTVESAGMHRGTTFSIMLQSTPPPAIATTTPAPQAPAPKLRVLIVEDHEDTVRAMKRLLERVGYEVNARHTVRDAVEAVAATSYDVLISDIGLPDGSGMDLIRQVRHAGSTIRAIAISGFGMDEDVRRSKEAGFQEHLTKPVNFARLQAMIATLTAGKNA